MHHRRRPALTTTQLTIHVPGNHLMRPLLGERDELLRMVEAAFPDASVHVRALLTDLFLIEQAGKTAPLPG